MKEDQLKDLVRRVRKDGYIKVETREIAFKVARLAFEDEGYIFSIRKNHFNYFVYDEQN